MSYKAMCGESTGLESDVLEEKQVLSKWTQKENYIICVVPKRVASH